MISALSGAPPMPMKVPKAIISTANISGGPNFKAISAKGSANKVNSTEARIAPMKETEKPVAMARPALPCLASGRPSNMVATDQGLPGTPNRMDVMRPPYMAPQ